VETVILLQFSALNDLASEAIKIFERSWPSHVDAVLPDGSLLGARADIYGAVPAGVQIRPPGYAPFSRTLLVQLAATDAQEAAWLAFLHAQIGKLYDMLAIAAFAVERDWREANSWFCSELAAAGLETCGWFPRPLADSANEITPRDLLLAVSGWAMGATL
jgi:hypothetical protein